MREYGYDYIGGKKVPQLVITEDYDLLGKHNGTIHVENGTLTINGKLNGTLDVQHAAKVIIIGKQNGSVNLESGALVIVHGEINGSTSLDANSNLVIEAGGKLAGSLANYGKVILRGVFGGARSGQGELVIEGNGYIKQPIIKDGISYYHW
jgi:cytoskeletal protein CcmA (bactofilin family)